MTALCPTCEEVQEVEYTDDTQSQVACLTCGDEFSPPDTSADKYKNYAGGFRCLCVYAYVHAYVA